MEGLLACTRAVHFAATLDVAGVVIFAVAIAEPAFARAKSRAGLAVESRRRLAWLAWAGLAISILSGMAWLVVTAASMSDQPLGEVLSGGVIWTVLSQTEFGNAWLVRGIAACLLAAALVPLFAPRNAPSALLKIRVAVLAAIFAGALAWSGHGAGGLDSEAIIHPPADVLHLIAAAAWVGALVPLALLLHAATHDPAALTVVRTATLRFSTLGVASVGTLLATGILNTWYLAGSIAALTGTVYGRLLIAKIALFLAMVTIAAVNRLRLTPQIVQESDPAGALHAARRLRRNAAIEATAGAAVIAIVGLLGTMAPAIHAAHHHPSYGAIPEGAAYVHIHSTGGMADVMVEPGHTGTARATIRLWNDDFTTLDTRRVTITLTPPAAGGQPVTFTATRGADDAWQAGGIDLPQSGDWTIVVKAQLTSGKELVLDAPIVIDPD